jgi:hypothetical protein
MFRKDPIFWCATGILVLGFVLFAITENQFWVALGIASYLLRPTMASLGIARKNVDERQMTIHYRSGNIGFAVLLITCVLCMAKLEIEGNHDFELFAMAIVVGLAAKALFNVILAKSYREGAAKIIIGVGLLIALFSVLDVDSYLGMLVSAAPGLAIAGVGLLSKKYPRPMGIVIFVLTALLMILIMIVGLKNSKSVWGQIAVAVVIGVPLITAGACLFIRDKGEPEVEPKRAM